MPAPSWEAIEWESHCGNLHLGAGLLRDLANEVVAALAALQGDVMPRRHIHTCPQQLLAQIAFMLLYGARNTE